MNSNLNTTKPHLLPYTEGTCILSEGKIIINYNTNTNINIKYIII